MNDLRPQNSNLQPAAADSLPILMHLWLYIASGSPNSVNAIANLKTICQNHPSVQIQVEVVDIWKESSRVLGDGILVTPTLRRLMPQPSVNIIGDLSDIQAVATALGLDKTVENSFK